MTLLNGQRRAIDALRSAPTTALVLGDVAYRIAMALYWIVLAYALTPGSLGLIALGNALAVPVFTVLDAGLAQYAVREALVGDDTGLAVPRDVARSLRRRPLTALVGTTIIAVLALILTQSQTGAMVGLLLGASYACDFVLQTTVLGYRARLNMIPDLVAKVWQGFVTLGVISGLVFFGETPSVVTIAAVSMLTYAGLLALLLAWDRPAISVLRAQAEPPRERGLRSIGPGGRRAFAFTAIIIALYSRLDALVIQVVLGSASLATYSIVFRLIEAGRVIPWAIGRVVLAAGSSDRSEVRQTVWRSRQLSTIVGIAASASIIIMGPSAVWLLFGRSYAEAGSSALMILGISVALTGYTSPLLSEVLAVGREAAVVRILLSVLATIAVASVPGVTIAGLAGIATAVVAGELVGALRLRRHASPLALDGRTIKALLVAGLTTGALALLSDPFWAGRLLGSIGITMCCGYAYWTVWSRSISYDPK